MDMFKVSSTRLRSHLLCFVLLQISVILLYCMVTFTGNIIHDKIIYRSDLSSGGLLKHIQQEPSSHVEFIPDIPDIYDYLQNVTSECLAQQQHAPNLCPCVPPNLKGKMRLNLTQASIYTWDEVYKISQDGHLIPGGMWSPPHCTPRRSLLIIVPYRDREQHLMTLLAHINPILQRQQAKYRILVIEQNLPQIFSKSSLLNAGYREAKRRDWDFDCVIFHDIDMLVEDDRCIYRCHGEYAIHYTVYLSRDGYKECCSYFMGGVVSFTQPQLQRVNGYSNNFFGWGFEDVNLHLRMQKANVSNQHPPEAVGRFTVVQHARDTGNPSFGWKRENNKVYRKVVNLTEGISTVKYHVIAEKYHELYTLIVVDVATVGLPYPTYRRTPDYFAPLKGHCPQQPTLKSLSRLSTVHECLDACVDTSLCASVTLEAPVMNGNVSCLLKGRTCVNRTLTANHLTYVKDIDPDLGAVQTHFTPYLTPCEGVAITKESKSNLKSCAKSCDKRNECKAFTCPNSRKRCACKLWSACNIPQTGNWNKWPISYKKIPKH